MSNILHTLKRNKTLVFSYVVSLIIVWLLLYHSNVKFSDFLDNSSQFNIISFNGLIAGFLFTSLSIIMTIAEKEGVKRLYVGGYLDQFYNTIILGIIHHVVAVVLGLITLLKPIKVDETLVKIQFISEIIGVCLFVISVFYLQVLLRLMKIYRKN